MWIFRSDYWSRVLSNYVIIVFINSIPDGSDLNFGLLFSELTVVLMDELHTCTNGPASAVAAC